VWVVCTHCFVKSRKCAMNRIPAQPGHIDDRRKDLLNARTSVALYQGLDVADQEKQDGEPTNAYIEGANYLQIEEMSLMPRRLLCPGYYGRCHV